MWKEFEFDHLFETPPKKPCFLAGTLVKTEKGFLPIEQIQTGDLVYAFNFERQIPELKSVTAVFVSNCDKYIEIQTPSDIIKATGGHRFWIPSKNKWIKARELVEGMFFQDFNGQNIEIVNLTIIDQIERTYNLEVEELQNYYVGKNQVLSHTKSIKESIFASTEIIEVEFYKFFFIGKILYLGQTTQEIHDRSKQHKAEFNRDNGKRPWIKFNPGLGYIRLDPNDITMVRFGMTLYEAAVVHLYEINAVGGIGNKDKYLFNKSLPIGKKRFEHYKKFGNFNPCLFYM